MAELRRWAKQGRELDAALSLRLPASVIAALDVKAQELGIARSDVLRAAIYGPTEDAWPEAAGTALVRETAQALGSTAARGAA